MVGNVEREREKRAKEVVEVITDHERKQKCDILLGGIYEKHVEYVDPRNAMCNLNDLHIHSLIHSFIFYIFF